MRLLEGKEQREEAQCPVEKHSGRRNQLSPPSTSARPGAFSNFGKKHWVNGFIPRRPFRFKGFWSEMVSWKREECLLGSSSFLSKPSSGKTLRTKRDINVTPEDLPGFFGAYIATRTRRYNAYLERVQSSASVSRILSRSRELSLHLKNAFRNEGRPK